jgi:hypothetical protein
VASSSAHASRRSRVASGNKRVKMVRSGGETKAGSSSHQMGHAWVCRERKYINGIPECHITKTGHDPRI